MEVIRMNNNFIDKLISVGLIENNQKSNLYYELKSFYKQSLEKYLDKILNLSIIENKFLSKIKYSIIPSNEFLKKYKVNSIWKIFYLKNEFFIERLSIDELIYLKEKYDAKSIDDEFIKNTYLKVTKYNENYPDNYYVHYPETNEDTYVMNSSLFLLIIVDIFQCEIDSFKEIYFDIIEKLNQLQSEVKENAKDISLEIIYMFN